MNATNHDRDIVVAALKHAAPYIRLFKGKVFVLKAGGELFADLMATRELIEQVSLLHQVGIKVVLVHGGGPQSTELAAALGFTSQFVQGRRVTDDNSLEIATMVLNGQINTRILSECRDLGVPAVGISGVDAGLISARRRPPVKMSGDDPPVDYGHVGDIDAVNTEILHTHMDKGIVPIVSPLSADREGKLLNINADTVAAALACALSAEKLIFCMTAPGILNDRDNPDSLVSFIDLKGLDAMREAGRLADGMLPKAAAIHAAISGGVNRVHLISHRIQDSLLLEIFTNEGTGTLVVESIDSLTPAEQASQAEAQADAS